MIVHMDLNLADTFVLFLALAAWVAAPLSLATLVFSRRQM